jgi:hypothetical protein
MNLKRVIKKIIDKNKEGEYWDFKQEWHKNNERLLHDILCFANTVHNKNCYLIIGVSDTGEVIGVTEDKRMKQANVLDLLANTDFAGDNTPEIKVDTIKIKDKKLDILTIINSYNLPYYLKRKSKKYKKIKEGYIYTRVGDKNTSINQNATIQQIEMLWKKKFGLTLPPLKEIIKRLNNKSEWTLNKNTYYNIYKPEFKLIEEYDDNEYGNSKAEFYVYTQCNSRFYYKKMSILCNKTVLKEFQLVILDSGRYKTPIPNWGVVGHDKFNVKTKYTYKYFLKNDIAYKLQQFLFNNHKMEEINAKKRFDEVILYYENKKEKLGFESYIENNQKLVEKYLKETNEVYFSIDASNDRIKRIEKFKLSTGLALKKLLRKYRNNINNSL